MLLLDHVSITVRDLKAARPFYEAVMNALGAGKVYDRPDALGFGVRCSPDDGWCFKVATRMQVRSFHEAGLAGGGRDDGAPGLRPHYHAHYFGAFLRDPEGNGVEAVCHPIDLA